MQRLAVIVVSMAPPAFEVGAGEGPSVALDGLARAFTSIGIRHHGQSRTSAPFQRVRGATSNRGVLVFGQKWRRNSTKATGIAGEANILSNTIAEEGFHVVGSTGTFGTLYKAFVLAAQIKATRRRVVEIEPLAKAFPAFGEIVRRPRKFEVVDVDDTTAKYLS